MSTSDRRAVGTRALVEGTCRVSRLTAKKIRELLLTASWSYSRAWATTPP